LAAEAVASLILDDALAASLLTSARIDYIRTWSAQQIERAKCCAAGRKKIALTSAEAEGVAE
jgi:hypothetical protein